MSGIVLLTFVWIAAVVSAQYTALIDLPSGQKLVGAGATFGPQTVNLVGFTKLFDPESACSGLNSGSFGASEIALVLRGNCSFSRKAMNAQQAGAVAVIVINYEDAVFSMTPNASETYSGKWLYFVSVNNLSKLADFQIPAVMISSSQGDTLRALSPNDKVTIRLYKRSPWDWSIVFLFLIGVITIVAGAYWSSAVERAQSYSLPAFRDPDVPNEDVAHMNSYAAFGFIIFASAGLLLMYFFIDKLIYVLLGIFAIGGANSLILSLSPLVRRLAPGLNQKISLRFLGEVEKTSIFLFPLCFGLAIWWVIERKSSYAWVLQDILGIALLLSIQRTLRLSSIKVSSILLCLAFVYDIFWVFLSPYFFAKSVMYGFSKCLIYLAFD
jgi:signal peptide peptidase-like protein 2B